MRFVLRKNIAGEGDNMKPNYGQALYDDFIHCAKALPVDADIFHVKDIYDNDSIIKQFSNGVRKPLIDSNTTGFE